MTANLSILDQRFPDRERSSIELPPAVIVRELAVHFPALPEAVQTTLAYLEDKTAREWTAEAIEQARLHAGTSAGALLRAEATGLVRYAYARDDLSAGAADLLRQYLNSLPC